MANLERTIESGKKNAQGFYTQLLITKNGDGESYDDFTISLQWGGEDLRYNVGGIDITHLIDECGLLTDIVDKFDWEEDEPIAIENSPTGLGFPKEDIFTGILNSFCNPKNK